MRFNSAVAQVGARGELYIVTWPHTKGSIPLHIYAPGSWSNAAHVGNYVMPTPDITEKTVDTKPDPVLELSPQALNATSDETKEFLAKFLTDDEPPLLKKDTSDKPHRWRTMKILGYHRGNSEKTVLHRALPIPGTALAGVVTLFTVMAAVLR